MHNSSLLQYGKKTETDDGSFVKPRRYRLIHALCRLTHLASRNCTTLGGRHKTPFHTQPQMPPPQNPFPAQPRPTRNTNPNTNTNPRMNFPERKPLKFTPIPMRYANLLPSLLSNQMVVVSPGKVYQSPFPRWYNPNTTCAYHGGVPGHSIEQCVAFKHKVQSLIDA